MRFCQSCGMPLTDDALGTNADGSLTQDYCKYCYVDGRFAGDFTMEQMVEHCPQYVAEYNKESGNNLTQDEYKNLLRQWYPTLKRWKSVE